MIPGVIESEITKIPLITHCVFGRHRPAYIRLMCGRFTSRLMWPSLYFLARRRAFRAQINESARKCSYYVLFSGGA
jgi:hypothetical protein